MDFGSQENASIVYAALAVDEEVNVLTYEFYDYKSFSNSFSVSFSLFLCFLQLQPDKVKRLMTVSNGKLSV